MPTFFLLALLQFRNKKSGAQSGGPIKIMTKVMVMKKWWLKQSPWKSDDSGHIHEKKMMTVAVFMKNWVYVHQKVMNEAMYIRKNYDWGNAHDKNHETMFMKKNDTWDNLFLKYDERRHVLQKLWLRQCPWLNFLPRFKVVYDE